jgi:hypothetical protein
MKPIKATKQSHTSNAKMVSGDNYGSAIKNKIGKNRYNSIANQGPIKGKMKPPKSLA